MRGQLRTSVTLSRHFFQFHLEVPSLPRHLSPKILENSLPTFHPQPSPAGPNTSYSWPWPKKNSHPTHSTQKSLAGDIIPYETRVYWIRRANAALVELEPPCPFSTFGSVVLNHTYRSSGLGGKLLCMSVNQNMQKGNLTLHGQYLGY
jgi:hypothetical protein